MTKTLNSRIPEGPVAEKWTNYKAHQRLVNPKNKLKLDVIVVGTGLAGASAAASLGEMGLNVVNFCIQGSPRRAHSIAAQGGILTAIPVSSANIMLYQKLKRWSPMPSSTMIPRTSMFWLAHSTLAGFSVTA